jgi:putative membrane protein
MRAFERSYSLLLGRSGRRLAVYATSLLMVLALVKTLTYPTAVLYYLAFGGLLFATLFVVDRRVVNPRRSYYVAVVSALVIAFFDVAFQKLPLTFALVGALTTALVAMALRCRGLAYLLPILLSAAAYYVLGQPHLALLSVLYAVVMYGLKPAINKMAGGLDAMCMFSSFLYAVFAEDDVIEDAFRELGKAERVPLHVYVVGGRHVVVVSDFHPGPFRHIGGGQLVDLLNREVEALGFRFTFLHGVGSHERDPVDRGSVLKIVEAVKTAVLSALDGKPPAGVQPREAALGDVKIAGFSLGAAPHLAVVSRLRSASDDIPTWVARRVDAGAYILVDAQNKFDGPVRWGEEDVKALSEGVAALHEAPLCRSFSVGMGKVDAGHLDPLGFEIGPAGISAVVNECDGVRGLLVVFDGNNLDAGLYEKVVSRYKGRGFRVVEVATTDTHRATGVGLGRGYRIVGERIDHGRILEAVDRAVAEAEKTLGAHPVSYRRMEVDAVVLGEEGFQRIQHAVRMYKKMGGLVAVAVFLAPVLLVLLFA